MSESGMMRGVGVVSMDTHRDFSKAVVMGPAGEVLDVKRVSHGDRSEMERYFAQFDAGTEVVMEATFNWPWIADLAAKMGLDPHLGHPYRLRKLAEGQAKTDRRDAIFNGKLWLTSDLFPESYLAPPEVRRMRMLFRYRRLLVRMRTMLKNSVHGQFLKLGVVFEEECSDLFSTKGRRILEGHPFASGDRAELERRLSAMDDLSKHIGEMDKLILTKLKEDPRAEVLTSLPGFGKLTAYGVLVEAGDFKRFPNRRALASYAGLLPVPDDSAGEEGQRHTAKRCNRFLRWALIEAVSGAVRASPRMRTLHARIKARNPKRPGMARVAVARELAELAHLLVDRGQKYVENPPGRPGSRPAQRKTRSRTRMPAPVDGTARR